MTRKRPFRDKSAWQVNVRFIRSGYTGHHIYVSDGSLETSRYTGKLIPKEFRISTKFIENLTREEAKALRANQHLSLIMPRWNIVELGLSPDVTYDLQRPTEYARSRGMVRRERTAGS